WWMMSARQSFQVIDSVIRFIVSSVFFYFLILEQWMFTVILIVLLAIMFLNNYFLSKKYNFLDWERLIENDAFQQAKFYQIVSMFAEVPHIRRKMKKRKLLSHIINRLTPFEHKMTY